MHSLVNVNLVQTNVTIYMLLGNALLCVLVKYPQIAITRKDAALRDRSTSEERLNLTWQQLVSSKHGFESFMNFLQREFAAENLLFVTEYAQVKKVVMQNERIHDKMENELELPFILNLPDTLPVRFMFPLLGDLVLHTCSFLCSFSVNFRSASKS